MRLGLRCVRVTILALRLLILYTSTYLRSPRRIPTIPPPTSPRDIRTLAAYERLWRHAHEKAGGMLAHHLGHLGGFWLKLGKYVSARDSQSVPPSIVLAVSPHRRQLALGAPPPLIDATPRLPHRHL
jgi:hypothetical protein